MHEKAPKTHELFLSYCRSDNRAPADAAGEGWVTAFEREIKERHKKYSGRELNIFEVAVVRSITQCFAVLDSFHRNGRPMDAAMRQLHAHLKPMFSHP